MTDPSALAHGGAPHVSPPAVLLRTAAALLLLTATTVALSRVELGRGNIVIALGLATTKAVVVALWFMHLRHGHRFHVVILAGAALFASLLVGFVLLDSTLYQPDLRAHDAASATPPPAAAPAPGR